MLEAGTRLWSRLGASRPVVDQSTFGPVVAGVRWAAVGLGSLLALAGPTSPADVAWAIVLVAVAASRNRDQVARPLAETVLAVVAVASTGAWESPFALCLVTGVIAAGFTRGVAPAGRLAAVVIVAVTLPYALGSGGLGGSRFRTAGQWSVELLVVAALAGYSRRLFREAEKRASASRDRASQLAEANELLVSLHRVAQSLPASLNLAEASSSTMARLRALVDWEVAVLLLREEGSGRWTVGLAEGLPLEGSLADESLPPALRAAAASSVASLVVTLGPEEAIGAGMAGGSGLYAPLRARGALVGLVGLEHTEAGHYGRRELRLLDGFIGPAALAVDNARWFNRLRNLGAEEERSRIARDVHDRVGQSLAYLSFKLERMAALVDDGPLREELGGLRTEVRGVLGEVRETLSDLRADVSDGRGMVETLETFLARVSARSEIEVSFVRRESDRLPLVQEREIWRIAQEAVTNVERHAKASHLRVKWTCDGVSALLTVADDGRGFSVGSAGRLDSYGLRGMRERADAIGARLTIESEPYVGTLVECSVGPAGGVGSGR